MNCLSYPGLEELAAGLSRGAAMELYLTPKPGLVDRADNGSHPDLSLLTMERSIAIVGDYLQALVVSLKAGEPFASQKELAILAERRLYDELGTNTHKGYIFLSGMLLIARRHAAGPAEAQLRQSLARLTGDFFHSTASADSNGERARRRFHTGGIVAEAMAAYPSLFDHALPVFRETLRRSSKLTTASFALMARLMQTVDDTTTLHRAGLSGLQRVRQDGQLLEGMIAAGENCLPCLQELNRQYRTLNITIGGVADMLGIAFGCLLACGEIGYDDFRER